MHLLRRSRPVVSSIAASALGPIIPLLHKADVPVTVIPDGSMAEFIPPEGDIAVVASFGRKIHANVISRFRDGGINMHPSLLPR